MREGIDDINWTCLEWCLFLKVLDCGHVICQGVIDRCPVLTLVNWALHLLSRDKLRSTFGNPAVELLDRDVHAGIYTRPVGGVIRRSSALQCRTRIEDSGEPTPGAEHVPPSRITHTCRFGH